MFMSFDARTNKHLMSFKPRRKGLEVLAPLLGISLLLLLINIQACGPSSTGDGDGTPILSCDTAEICDGIDQNCNGEIDEGVLLVFYDDADGDGFGDPDTAAYACSAPEAGMVSVADDCDDENADANPDASEACNGFDDDCDGHTDDSDDGVTGTTTWYRDEDLDGYGVQIGSMEACEMPPGYADNTDDCNDGNPAAHPGAKEVCDGVDNDCDTAIDDNQVIYYRDADEDGFGDSSDTQTAGCTPPSGYVADSTDCNDGDAAIKPGATETQNGIDDNCNGGIDEGVIALAAGSYHSLAVLMDGTVWSWGYNYHGQLGLGVGEDGENPDDSHIAVQIPELSGAIAVSGGEIHSMVLLDDGTVWCFGDNHFYQIGDGTDEDQLSPVQVPGLEDVVAIAAGGHHSMALKGDGTVWTWGSNTTGQLGDGTTEDSAEPIKVSGLSDVVGIAGGLTFSTALKSDGTGWAWGNNAFGQLGDGTTFDHYIPAKVENLPPVTALAGGTFHTVARASDGTAWAWGWNETAQLGDGSTEDRTLPVQVLDLAGVVAVGAALSNSGAMVTDGTVWFWGDNREGQLGDGTNTASSTPVQVEWLSQMIAITVGSYHTLAGGSDGSIWSWGSNTYGQLGNDTTEDSNFPVYVMGLP